uniref:ATP synthase complex subunit 8 n=1 Tax=Callosobruchus maculatus TaxID=64391 RepID=A0A7M3UIR1_CALMS|nr:ATP synthase F0 subunit 8 [Callosobruchus maculatus]YP_010876294.1 ATP synthase F0 subunit 8 [Bruchus pisorum]QOH99476.1 ATP synthase F0 subunit 8 [Callosobruchus maculatus]WHE17345.1 ATP synthase F0 subunit 8 [Bruchus pisorum]
MPQMAPLNWLTLMIFFIMIFFMFNIMNFFSFSYPIKKSKLQKKTIKFNWKW